MACVPIAGIGGVVGGVAKSDQIKRAYHRTAAHVTPSHRSAAIAPKFTPFIDKEVITENCMMPVSTSPMLLASLGRDVAFGPIDTPSTARIAYPGTSYPSIIGGGFPGTPGGGGSPPTTTPTPTPTSPPTTNPPPPSSVVPEPKTWAMMGMGFGAMGVALRIRRRYDKREPSV